MVGGFGHHNPEYDGITVGVGITRNYPSLRPGKAHHAHQRTAGRYGRVRRLILKRLAVFNINGGGYAYLPPPKLIDDIQKEKDEEIEVCTTGQGRAYIVSFENGRFSWDLEGHYPGLHDLLKKKRDRARLRVRQSSYPLAHFHSTPANTILGFYRWRF